MNYRNKWLSCICSAAMMVALLTTSCAEGIDDDERFNAGVSNTQLEAPTLNESSFSVQVNADGSENVVVTWPVVYGAGGYLVNVTCNNPNDPYVVKDQKVDGCRFLFPREVDTKYVVSVSTLGNEKLNNTGSPEPATFEYSTVVPGITIPSGMEISQFIAANLPASSTDEIAFELIGGETYILNDKADLHIANVTIRGDRYNRAYVVVQNQGGFINQNGVNLRYINFDMSDAPLTSLITMSGDPDPRFSTEALGLKALSEEVKNGYIVQNPVSIESCNLRNVPSSLIASGQIGDGGSAGWGYKVIRINDCIVQFNKANSKPAISLEDNWGFAGIEMMVLSNSTFYNLADYKCRFLRYGVRMRPGQAFGPGATTNHTLKNCTFYKTFTGDQFANNMDNSGLVADINHCIFYDIMRVDQYCFRNGTSTTAKPEDNVSWLGGADGSLHGNMLKMSTEIDPDFAGPTTAMFDLNEPKGGVNFRPQSSFCLTNGIGDPRWLE
ncbi:MAG: DUF4957 domain-containing protein [Duncaniella sp.]|nr:DUF4957 domain-containing protein [Duncaniella sp.]